MATHAPKQYPFAVCVFVRALVSKVIRTLLVKKEGRMTDSCTLATKRVLKSKDYKRITTLQELQADTTRRTSQGSFQMEEKCFVHIPKTGGTSVEKILGWPHAHHHADPSCPVRFVMLRDPIERLSSAYEFCRMHPWDRVLSSNPSAHCCRSNFVRRVSLSSWLLLTLNGTVDCSMPRSGHPHSFVSSTTYWLKNPLPAIVYLRTHCLSHDTRPFTNRTTLAILPHTNRSPNSACPTLTIKAWNAMLQSPHASDFERVYNCRIRDAREWKKVCNGKKTRLC